MNLTPTALMAHARSDAGRRAIRYSATSVVGVVGTQILFQLLLFTDLQAHVANFIATSLMSGPAFLLNKHWVWGKSGKAHLRREVLPFWAFTAAGWALSTVTVFFVSRWTEGDGSHRVAVGLASIAGFGVLWVLKYLFLDQVMFGPHHHTPYDEDLEAEEDGAGAGSPEAAAVPTVEAPPAAR